MKTIINQVGNKIITARDFPPNTWVTRDYKDIPYSELTLSHLKNIIKWTAQTAYRKSFYNHDALVLELNSRLIKN